jgi:hypothetical protein
MLHVEQWTLRSRIEMTEAAVPDAPAWEDACIAWEGIGGKGFAGNVIALDGEGTGGL